MENIHQRGGSWKLFRVHFPGSEIITEPSGGWDGLELEFPKWKGSREVWVFSKRVISHEKLKWAVFSFQGSVLGPLLFLAYVSDIWRNIESTIRLFADDCMIYRKIINNADMEKLQKDLDRLGEWAVENAMKINPSKSKAIRFTRARVNDPPNYS